MHTLSGITGVAIHLLAISAVVFSGGAGTPLTITILASGMLCVANIASSSDPAFPTKNRPMYAMIGIGIAAPLVYLFCDRLAGNDRLIESQWLGVVVSIIISVFVIASVAAGIHRATKNKP